MVMRFWRLAGFAGTVTVLAAGSASAQTTADKIDKASGAD
jgi:hypothetical protein